MEKRARAAQRVHPRCVCGLKMRSTPTGLASGVRPLASYTNPFRILQTLPRLSAVARGDFSHQCCSRRGAVLSPAFQRLLGLCNTNPAHLLHIQRCRCAALLSRLHRCATRKPHPKTPARALSRFEWRSSAPPRPAPPPATAMKITLAAPPPATKSVSPEKPMHRPAQQLKQLVATADADQAQALATELKVLGEAVRTTNRGRAQGRLLSKFGRGALGGRRDVFATARQGHSQGRRPRYRGGQPEGRRRQGRVPLLVDEGCFYITANGKVAALGSGDATP